MMASVQFYCRSMQRHLHIAAIAFAVACGSSGTTEDHSGDDRSIEELLRAIPSANAEASVPLLEEALARRAELPAGFVNDLEAELAMVLLELGSNEAAMQHAEAALLGTTTTARVGRAVRGRVYLRRGDSERAIEDLVLCLGENDADLYLGQAYRAVGNINEARLAFMRCQTTSSRDEGVIRACQLESQRLEVEELQARVSAGDTAGSSEALNSLAGRLPNVVVIDGRRSPGHVDGYWTLETSEDAPELAIFREIMATLEELAPLVSAPVERPRAGLTSIRVGDGGVDEAQVRSVAERNSGGVRYCIGQARAYARAHERGSDMPTNVVIRASVDSTGRVLNVVADTPNSLVKACCEETVASWQFPESSGTSVDVELGFAYIPAASSSE